MAFIAFAQVRGLGQNRGGEVRLRKAPFSGVRDLSLASAVPGLPRIAMLGQSSLKRLEESRCPKARIRAVGVSGKPAFLVSRLFGFAVCTANRGMTMADGIGLPLCRLGVLMRFPGFGTPCFLGFRVSGFDTMLEADQKQSADRLRLQRCPLSGRPGSSTSGQSEMSVCGFSRS
jgi:hypothetical protein